MLKGSLAEDLDFVFTGVFASFPSDYAFFKFVRQPHGKGDFAQRPIIAAKPLPLRVTAR
jgi:hypothetical protein